MDSNYQYTNMYNSAMNCILVLLFHKNLEVCISEIGGIIVVV